MGISLDPLNPRILEPYFRTKYNYIIAFLLFSLSLSSCIHYGYEEKKGGISFKGSLTGDIDYFSYNRDNLITPHIGKERDRGKYTIRKIEYPSLRPGNNNDVMAYFYRPNGGGGIKFPAIVVLPITLGDFHSKYFSIYLAERGFITLRFKSTGDIIKNRDESGLEDIEEIFRYDVIDIMRGIDWLLEREEVKKDKIGIVGISLGAITGSLVAEVDHRIKAGVFILGGGDLSGIIQTSKEGSLVDLRENIMNREELTEKEFYEEAKDVLKRVDPLHYASLVDPERVLMINAYYDKVIRRRFVYELWEERGRPELVFLPTGHYSASLFLSYARYKTINHFRRIFRAVEQ